jgi:putative colanic acid biosysnthesis UDP-glucose lipid carrier transferase
MAYLVRRTAESTDSNVTAEDSPLYYIRGSGAVSLRPQEYAGLATHPQALHARRINGSKAKRLFDIGVAAAVLIFLCPALLLIALAICLDSPGPILFRQERYGRGREIFVMCKFRSMTVLERSGPFQQATRNDARVTRVGRLLRRTSLDELPQLINVLKGEMSLVGPRPHAVTMDDAFAEVIPDYSERHLVRPGLTGLAQISGFRGPTDALVKIEHRTMRDRLYIRRWTFLLDLYILLRTPTALLGPNAF